MERAVFAIVGSRSGRQSFGGQARQVRKASRCSGFILMRQMENVRSGTCGFPIASCSLTGTCSCRIELLALQRLPKNKPVTMLAAAMVRRFPPGVDNWPLACLDYAVAGAETGFAGSLYEIHMRPLVLVIVDIVCDFAEQNSFRPQNPLCLFDEWRIRMREAVASLLPHCSNSRTIPFLGIITRHARDTSSLAIRLFSRFRRRSESMRTPLLR
jgi:hypothetical protein